MALTAGTRLGPYEVLASVGAGGMGEVYRARDTKLGRDVAIKILPESFAHDPERLARFEREAKTLASLNHPNIATIHGLEEADGAHALVMELVEGEDLSQRIACGPIPLDEALPIARQIAEALEAAHDRGIVHRDLKPANIKLRPDGTVKVLDFGLAKALGDGYPTVDAANSPTITSAGTRMGVIVGTAAYMSPEQARGKAVDKRADIWAFGAVLYEMLTGNQAFRGGTVTDTLAAVLNNSPAFDALPTETPSNIQTLLTRCFERDRLRRLRDIGEARIVIEDALSGSAAAAVPVTPPARATSPWRRAAPFVLVAAAILAGVVVWSQRAPAPAPIMRFDLVLPDGDRLNRAFSAVAISPDGRHLVYDATRNDRRQLFLRAIGDSEPRPIPGTFGAFHPFFSPDGEWIGFFADGKLQKVAVAGGAPLALGDAVGGTAGTWGPHGAIVFAAGGNAGLMRLPVSGGTPDAVTTLRRDQRERSHRWPQILPGGRAIVFGTLSTDTKSFDEARIEVVSLETGDRKTLVQGGDPRYVPTGHILFVRSGDLFAVPFDTSRLEVRGDPVRVLTGVSGSSIGNLNFTVSETGSLVFVSGPPSAERDASTLVLVNRQGAAEPTGTPARQYAARARVSPDGRQVVVETIDFTHTVWVYDLERRTLNRLSSGGGRHEPSWMPDGRHVTFTGGQFFRQVADGSAPEEAFASTKIDNNFDPAGEWSPDGKLFVFTRRSSDTRTDIWGFAPDDQQRLRRILQTPFEEFSPKFSPDGRWLTYVSDASGRDEVYVQAFPGPGRKWQVSTEGGTEPVWARSGREIFYRQKEGMFAVGVTTTPDFATARPERLFEGSYAIGVDRAAYDVMPDGQRFLMVKQFDQAKPATQMHIVLNWFDELKRLAPTK